MINFTNTKNKVELIGVYGSDESHALSAWTSTSRELDVIGPDGKSKLERIPGLLNMLASNGHHTPFEKSSLHFLCTTDIATHIQLLKHRIGTSLNGESARYKELKDDKLYIPIDWPEDEVEKYLSHMEKTYTLYHETLEKLVTHYTVSLGMTKKQARARAKESARFYLPYGNQLTCDVMFNFRSFAHFIGLRYADGSQKEIKLLAEQMLKLVIETGAFKHTLSAFKFTNPDGTIVQPFEKK